MAQVTNDKVITNRSMNMHIISEEIINWKNK